MGKHKKQSLLKQTRPAPAPVTVDEDARQSKVLPLISALQSMKEDERLTAIDAICDLIENETMLQMLLRERLIKIIFSNTLSDSNVEIVALGFQVLRTVSLLNGRDQSVFMIREGITQYLNRKASETLISLQSDDLNETQYQYCSKMISGVMGLISALIIAIGEFKDIDDCVKLACFLITQDHHKVTDQSLVDSYEMVYYQSESNPSRMLELVNADGMKTIAEAAHRNSSWSIKIFGMGSEFNTLLSTLDFEEKDLSVFMTRLEQLVQFLYEVPDLETSAIQLCLELIALAAQTSRESTLTFLVDKAIPKVLQLIEVSEYTPYCVSLLNNIGWSLNSFGEDWSDLANTILERAMKSCFSSNEPPLIASALGLLSALLLENDSVSVPDLRPIADQAFVLIQKLLQQNDPTWEDLSRRLIVLLSIKKADQPLADRFGVVSQTVQMILAVLEHTNDPETISDVLNSTFDIFGDNNSPFNQIEYKDAGVNGKLEKLSPRLKRILKSVPKSLPARYEMAITSFNTLQKFIQYKRSGK